MLPINLWIFFFTSLLGTYQFLEWRFCFKFWIQKLFLGFPLLIVWWRGLSLRTGVVRVYHRCFLQFLINRSETVFHVFTSFHGCLFLSRDSAEMRGNGVSGPLDLKIFLGEVPRTPRQWLRAVGARGGQLRRPRLRGQYTKGRFVPGLVPGRAGPSSVTTSLLREKAAPNTIR